MSERVPCYHCGEECREDLVQHDGKSFCCNGCKLVYEILSEHRMKQYYTLQAMPGVAPPTDLNKAYDYLEKEEVIERLVSFRDRNTMIVTLYIPGIHCSSCIWLLENLYRLNPAVHSSRVNFPRKEVQLSFDPSRISLRQMVELLSSVGYAPEINLDRMEVKRRKIDRSLIYQIGVAGFCFGNIMLISLPEYLGMDYLKEPRFASFFGYVNLVLSLPVLLYSARNYFISAWKGLRKRIINIDVPIALGIVTLFLRSLVEIVLSLGAGYLDSLASLVFVLLLGKAFQQVTYNTISFERDYRSYFPIAVTRIAADGSEGPVQVSGVEIGDRLLIRNQEIIPVDALLEEGRASIDNSFVTGESALVEKMAGDRLFAGGRQVGGAIVVRATRKLSQSYLTQLWNNEAFTKERPHAFEDITNRISKHFTLIILLIALASALFWIRIDPNIALNAFTAVLIVACPCALAMSAPFTFGNVLRILGRNKFYLKGTATIEGLALTNHLVLDKTGTITQSSRSDVRYEGSEPDDFQRDAVFSLLRQSSHPLSKIIFNTLRQRALLAVEDFEEIAGQGIRARISGREVRLGSAPFTGHPQPAESPEGSRVFLSIDGMPRGGYTIGNKYRPGLRDALDGLKRWHRITLLTGDNESEKVRLEQILGKDDLLRFRQSPQDKLEYVEELQRQGQNVMMVGDGLNDAGALKQSNIGISVSEDVNTFSPACDAILDASAFARLPLFVRYARLSIRIVIASFVISFLYNVVGLWFAVSGQLAPVIA
ncbi:MAG TPA: heavy metal translocating P-type ATPase metal-binding domain-containing protein, partial [Bacteroidales bacterium]|nr:heavy metal translocating P-type ATPase metal-binding domain-containing protein [Bacteroidales bacterium]